MKNACDTYEMMLFLDPCSVKDLLKAHKMMMEVLIPENGGFRSGRVGVFGIVCFWEIRKASIRKAPIRVGIDALR